MILDRDLIYVEANPAYCVSTDRTREEIVGRYVFEAFPPTGEGGRQIEESLRRVLATGIAETLPLAAYPIPTADGGFRMKYWSCAHLPLLDENGDVAFVAQNAVDVTELQNLRAIAYGPDPGTPSPGESDLFRRALEVTAANDSLMAEIRGLRDLFMQAPGFMAVLMGPELIYAQANNAYLQLIGHRPVVGRSLADALPEVMAQGFGDLLLSVMRNRTPHIGRATSVMLQRAQGAPLEERFVDFIFQPIAGSEGESVGVFIEGSDVTDRVRAEQALSHREEQLRLATEAAEVGLWDLDWITGALYWPPVVKAMFGIFPDASVTMDDFYAGLHPEDREATAAAFEAAVDPSRRDLYDVEYRTVGKEDRVVRWVAAKGRAIFDDLGRCSRVIGTAINITGRKANEGRLRELNETLERRVSEALAERKILADIVEGTDAFVQVADLEYRWMAINTASADEFEALFGKRPQPGDNMLEILADRPDQAAAVKAVWSRALAGEEFTQVVEFGDPGRDRRWYEMKFNVLRDRDGRQVGAYQFVYNVTDRLRDQARLAEAEAALRQAQKLDAIGQLTGGVAHDFNNLLMVILGGLSMIERPGDLVRRRRVLDGMRQAAERGASLSRQLLAFARRQPLRAEPIDLRAQLEGMRDLLDRTLRGDVHVRTDFADDLWTILADPAELELVLLNLCVNARDAMPDGGTITIAALNTPDAEGNDGSGDFVRLSVADTGVGMSPEVLAHVFEPFYTTKPIGKGSGLGLPQVYGFAEQSGGSVRVESAVGKGTTVVLTLPRTEERPADVDTLIDLAEPQPEVSGSVLLVEDDDEVASLVTEMLSELGFAVTRAASAEAALGALADGRAVDVLFSDIMMPGQLNGIDLAREAKRRRPGVPVLLTSGYADAAIREASSEDIPVLRKPYDIQSLATSLADVMNGANGKAR
jgi:signal transduction histidine kinase/CheY-like chemotaxis protein